MSKMTSRRHFLKTAATSTIAAGTVPTIMLGEENQPTAVASSHSPNDTIRIGTIGMGKMGFGDTRTALQVPGVELVGVADCYDGRLMHAKEVFGDDLFVTRAYQEILDRTDIDAVIVATPDHWHSRIGIDALQAGKDVYLEKPMVQDLEEGVHLIEAEQKSGRILQVGSQYVSSILYDKVKELYEAGTIGKLNMVEAWINRNSAMGAWQYSIPLDASPETVAWERFLGEAPERPFSAKRFFRWRNYWDYGTGIAGDLFVHLFSALHYVLNSKGPAKISSTGGLRNWKDGRDVPDVQLAHCEYLEQEGHPPFTFSLQVNLADGGNSGAGFRFLGDEGVLDIDLWGRVTVKRPHQSEAPGYTVGTFAEDMQEKFLEEYREEYSQSAGSAIQETSEISYRTPSGYNMRLDHFKNFFEGMRSNQSVVEDATFGFRAAAPALLCNHSYREDRVFKWDPSGMKVLS